MQPTNLSPASPWPLDPAGGKHVPLAVLRQYVAGTLPATEQHRVEAHTLSCARCADVLAGLSQTDLRATDQALTTLQNRLRARVALDAPAAAPQVVRQPWRQLVAAVLLVLLGATVWWNTRRAPQDFAASQQARQQATAPEEEARPAPGLAATDQAQPSAEIAKVDDEQIPAAARVARAAPTPARQSRTSPARPSRPASTPAGAPAQTVADQTTGTVALASDASGLEQKVVADTVLLTQGKDASISKAERKKNRKISLAMAPAQSPPRQALLAETAVSPSLRAQIAVAMPAPANNRVVRGRVTDGTGKTGLPGVTVMGKGTNSGTSTAADGAFALVVPESVRILTFSSIGYNTTEQVVPATDSLPTLALAPDNKQLSEVVVVRREPPPAPAAVGALPAGGYRAFREYLGQNLKYPEQALTEQQEGTVRLRFVVAADGSLQDIKVLRSVSAACDAEAIRLLTEGPNWYPAIVKGRRTARPVEISVPFRGAK